MDNYNKEYYQKNKEELKQKRRERYQKIMNETNTSKRELK